MKTRIEIIEKKPKCIVCGKEAHYHFERFGFLYHYRTSLCFECLREHLIRLKVFVYREIKK